MKVYDSHSRLCDVVFAHPGVIPVLNRFSVALGLGDATIAEICKDYNISANFFLAILNTHIFPDYFPEEQLKSFSIPEIIGYLQKTDHFYRHFQLPNIERHFNSLVNAGEYDNSSLSMLRKFFMEMKQELSERISADTHGLFPRLLSGASLTEEESRTLTGNDLAIEDKIHDLASFFVVHLRGEYDKNLCFAVVSAIFALEKDVKQDNRIRHRILLPMLGHNPVAR